MEQNNLPEQILYQEIKIWEPKSPPEKMVIHMEIKERLLRLVRHQGTYPRVTVIRGKRGSGKKLLMKQAAYVERKCLFFMELPVLFRLCMESGTVLLAVLKEQLELQSAWLCLTVQEQYEGLKEWAELLFRMTEAGLSFYLLTQDSLPIQEEGCEWAEILVPTPGIEEKGLLWSHFLEGYPVQESVDARSLGNRYVLNAGEIRQVLRSARLLGISRGAGLIQEEDIVAAIRTHNKGSLGTYARRVKPAYTFEDLIVEDSVRQSLRDICNQILYRNVVGERWGFYRKRAYGRGLSVMFYGPPGTGKTMAAQVLSRELGMELYRVDLSQMMSKYIGETQKNISRLFEEAAHVQAILFFDEADAFFSRRTEVKDSHDRNSNGEVAHLLQQMEDYEGISILATNLKDNMDDAFKRRIKMMIPFGMPGRELRLQMWQRALPARTPREGDLNLDFFAARYELPGSEIQDILMSGAFLAAAEGGKLGNRHIIRALKSSFVKYGRVLGAEEFKELEDYKDENEGYTL